MIKPNVDEVMLCAYKSDQYNKLEFEAFPFKQRNDCKRNCRFETASKCRLIQHSYQEHNSDKYLGMN